MNGRRFAWALAGASLALHLAYALIPAAREGRMPMDEGMYRELAEHLAAHGRMYLDGSAFNTIGAGETTLFWTPGYPLLLAAIVKSGLPFLASVWTIQCALLALLPVLLLPLARRLLPGRRSHAFLALAAFYPYHFPLALQVGSEALAAFLLAACLGLAASGEGAGLARIAGTGALAAALALTRPEFLLFAALLGSWWMLRLRPSGPRRSAAGLSAFALAGALLIVPWMLRNHGVTGGWIFTTRSGYSLVFQNEYYSIAGSDSAEGEAAWMAALPSFPTEIERYAYLKGRGAAFIRSHPGAYARLCAKRLASFAVPLGAKHALARAFGRGEARIQDPPIGYRLCNDAFLALAWGGLLYALWKGRGRVPVPVLRGPEGLLAAMVAGQIAVYAGLAYIEYQRSLIDPEILLLIAWAASGAAANRSRPGPDAAPA